MSKSKGTFIQASDYLKHLDPEFLRYYFASKLNDGIEDIDLNFNDLTKKINSDIVGKLINLASRCSTFIEKNSSLKLSEKLENNKAFEDLIKNIEKIENFYDQRKYSNAISTIMSMTDKANQYINEKKPWTLSDKDQIQKIATQGINYFRTIVILLSPVMPDLLEKTENLLNEKNLSWESSKSPILNKKINKFEPLKNRIQKEDTEKLKTELTSSKDVIEKKKENNMKSEIDYSIFSNIDLRVGEIIKSENVEGADKLIKLQVDLGDLGEKQIFAGVKEFYNAEDLVGLKTVVVANLKPKTMKFGISSGMVLAANSDGKIIIISTDNKITNGSKIK